MRIADNVEMLEISGMGTIYPTIAWDADNLALIDAGFPGQSDAIVQAIAAAGFAAESLTHIIITHHDLDHIGCVTDLLKLSPSALVLAHEAEAPYLDGRKTPVKLAAMQERYDSLTDEHKALFDQMKVAYAGRITPVGQVLHDCDVLPICGGIEVIHTPGHTLGHICLFLRASGILLCGDALNVSDGELVGPHPQHTYDMGLAQKSAEKVIAYPYSAAVTYHGGYLMRA